jgi:acyl-CoA thioester hydrolase
VVKSAAVMACPDGVASFRQRIRVDGADIDELGHASNVSYLRWVQKVAKGHSEAVGWDYAQYLDAGAVFVVRRHEIDYLRPALEGDELELCTWVDGWRAATSTRYTSILRGEEELARASTLWAFVSTDGGRPQRIPAELVAAFAQEVT